MNFELANPTDLQQALDSRTDTSRWFAGGTDLLPGIKSELAALSRLVNLKRIEGLRGIQVTDEGVRIGALVTLAELAEHEWIQREYHALAQACDLSASPQIRNAATIGGNLNQDSRCVYFRNGFPCYLRGGGTCFMREGENREAAVIGYTDCVHVHPSDPAVALTLFDARVVTRGGAGERVIPLGDFFRAPDAADRRMNVLAADEIITAIELPRSPQGAHSVYVKAMDRATWAFALASAAVYVRVTDGQIADAGIVLGGVAPTPRREFRIAQTLCGMDVNETTVTQATRTLLDDAQPLSQNGYKVHLARGMVKKALRKCLESGE